MYSSAKASHTTVVGHLWRPYGKVSLIETYSLLKLVQVDSSSGQDSEQPTKTRFSDVSANNAAKAQDRQEGPAPTARFSKEAIDEVSSYTPPTCPCMYQPPFC